jgi:peroxiredoxin
MSLKRRIHEFLGGSKMAALEAGAKAPTFTLQSADGKKLNLADALKKGPVVAAFFKVSCPTCQFAAPYLERLHETYGGEKFTFWGISQDDAQDTREFLQEFDVEFPTLIDEDGYPVSNQYGITNVPSVFLISPDGQIQESSVGFSKKDFEKIAAAAAKATNTPTTSFFKPSEVVPAIKPG